MPQRKHSTVNRVGGDALRFISYGLANGFGIVRMAEEAAGPAEHCRERALNLYLLLDPFPPILEAECGKVAFLESDYISDRDVSFPRHGFWLALIIRTVAEALSTIT